jgi:hypothetical protein
MEEADSRLIEKHWPYPVFQYVNGKLDAQELLDLASDNNRLTEAQCYIGMQEMINNNKQEALKSFRWVAHHGNKSLPEYNLSAANLMHLTKQTLLSSR